MKKTFYLCPCLTCTFWANNNQDGAFCWACNPDARAEEKASLDAKNTSEAKA